MHICWLVFPILLGQSTNGGQPNSSTASSLGTGEGARATYLSGKVSMQDGSPVPENVTIQRVCSGVAKTVAYTDANGRFNFRWADSDTAVSDASNAGTGPSRGSTYRDFGSSQSAGGTNPFSADPMGDRMMNCGVRASLAGFASDTVNLLNRRNADGPDVGIIVLRRIAEVVGSSISVTSMMAPKDAKKAYERGLQDLLKNKPADAAKGFEKAVAIYPKFADAWVNLAKLRLQQGAAAPARTAFLKAMEADPKLVAPYIELGLMAAKDANWKQSGDYLDQAVKLDPVDFAQAWYADAVAHYNLAEYEAAEKSVREAVKLDPRHVNPRSGYLLGLVLAEKHDYQAAAAELTAYLKLVPDAPDAEQVKQQLAGFEKQAAASR